MILIWLISLLLKSPVMFLIAVIVLIIPLLISITVHEWAHGMVAYKFGDPTPKLQGRLSFNPFAHLDPVGTLMLFIIGIGWAKPVQIDPRNIPGKTKQMLVALAGPASNFLLAIIFGFIYFGINNIAPYHNEALISMLITLIGIIIRINIILGVFNMLPIPPLDGSKLIIWLLPENLAQAYAKLARFGMVILLLILFSGGFRFVISAADFLQRHLYHIIELILKPIFS